jgi:PilZ domain-containing protein
MKLPLREFADVVAALKTASDKNSAAEVRQVARMQVYAKVDLHLLVDGKPARSFSALTRDISLTGVGLLQSVALPPNQELIIAMPRPNGLLYVHAVVKYCRALADGLLTAGIEYTKLADSTLVAALVQQNKDSLARIAASVMG